MSTPGPATPPPPPHQTGATCGAVAAEEEAAAAAVVGATAHRLNEGAGPPPASSQGSTPEEHSALASPAVPKPPRHNFPHQLAALVRKVGGAEDRGLCRQLRSKQRQDADGRPRQHALQDVHCGAVRCGAVRGRGAVCVRTMAGSETGGVPPRCRQRNAALALYRSVPHPSGAPARAWGRTRTAPVR